MKILEFKQIYNTQLWFEKITKSIALMQYSGHTLPTSAYVSASHSKGVHIAYHEIYLPIY